MSVEPYGRLAGFALAALAVVLVPFVITSDYYLQVLTTGALYSITVLGLYFAFGMAGQISFGQAGLVGVGAYGAGLLAVKADLGFVPAVLAGVVLAAIFGLLLGFPALRLSGHYLALATLGFGVVVQIVLTNWTSLTGGAIGLQGVPIASVFGARLDSRRAWFWLAGGLVLLLVTFADRLRRSSYGRALSAMRDSEVATESIGISTSRLKVLAFVLAAATAGLTGALNGFYVGYISPDTYNLDLSVLFLVMLIIGGLKSPWGAVAGGILLELLPEALRPMQDYYLVVYGALVLLVVTTIPDGLVGIMRGLAALLGRRIQPAGHAAEAISQPEPDTHEAHARGRSGT